MAEKTLTIDTEACGLPERHEQEGPSVSRVTGKHSGTGKTGTALLRIGPEADFEDSTLDAIADVVQARSREPGRPIRLGRIPIPT